METWFGAIELGGTKVLCSVGPSARAPVAETRVATTTAAETMAAVQAFFAPFRGKIAAVGIASFGPIELRPGSANWGTLLATPKQGWTGAAIGPPIAHSLGVPVRIDTDVNAAALAEQREGAALGADPCVYITVGTGVGVGVIANGGPLHGIMHPELGHLSVPAWCDFSGICPFHGRCVEGIASAPAIHARTGKDAADLADDDPAWELEAAYLAHLVCTCVLAYAPQKVVLGGGVLQRSGLIERIREQVVAQLRGYVPRPQVSPEHIATYVVPAGLGQRAGLHGAYLLAQEPS